MTCIICNGNDIRTTDVQEELKVGDDIVYVPVRIPVCANCGERYYDRQTLRYLEGVEEKLRQGEAQLQQVGKILKYR